VYPLFIIPCDTLHRLKGLEVRRTKQSGDIINGVLQIQWQWVFLSKLREEKVIRIQLTLVVIDLDCEHWGALQMFAPPCSLNTARKFDSDPDRTVVK
jgi:hypothetical protein